MLDPVRRDYIQARMLGLGFIADKGMATPEELAKLAELQRIWEEKVGLTKAQHASHLPPNAHHGSVLPPTLTKTLLLPEPAPEPPVRFGTGRDRVQVETVREPAGGRGGFILAAGAAIMAGWGWVPFTGFVSGVISTIVAKAVAHG